MDIAALSMSISSVNTMQQANLSVMKNAMNMQTEQVNSLIEIMQSAPVATPPSAHSFDVRV